MRRFRILLAQRARRDAVQIALWVLGTAALAAATWAGVSETFGSEQGRSTLLATAIANPVVLLFRGLPSGADDGAFLAFLILPFLAMLAAFMSSFLAVRHTRTEEEQGRAELVASTPAGRALPLAATVAHGVLANLALGALCAVVLLPTGLGASGAVTMGVAAAAVGVAFLGVGLLAAQLVRTSRAANSLGVWLLVTTYLAAGIGNAIGTPSADVQRIESSWLAWLSPFGWAENTRPYDADDLGPLLLCVAVAVAGIAAAFALQSARDLGGSLLPERQGRGTASAPLSSPVGLAWRLSRGAVLGWVVGGVLTGVLATRLGAVISEIGEKIPAVQQIAGAVAAGGSLEQAAVAIFFTLLGVLAACAAVQTVCRARQEETHGTAETVLATPVGRVRWLGGYAVVGAGAIVATVAGAIAGAIGGLASVPEPDWTLLADVLVTGAGQAVAASVFLALTALVFVLAPRLTIPLGWSLVLVGTILGLFGRLFGFPDALVDLSPVSVAPTVIGDEVELRGLWWLVLATGVGLAASLTLMRRRELSSPA